MTKFEIIISILAAIGLIGLTYLIGADKDIGLYLPIVTGLFAYLLGKKQKVMLSSFKKQ